MRGAAPAARALLLEVAAEHPGVLLVHVDPAHAEVARGLVAANLVASLVEGSLDVLLVALPIARRDVATRPVFREPFLLAAPRDHPPARGRGGVRQQQLDGEPVLLLEDGHCLRDQALDVCRRAGARESEQVRATSLTTLVQMVAGGLGVTLLPASAVEAEVRGREVTVRPFRAPAPSREIGLAWRRASARAEEFALLGDLLARHVPKLRR